MRKFVKRVFSILVTLTLLITSEVPAFATDLQPVENNQPVNNEKQELIDQFNEGLQEQINNITDQLQNAIDEEQSNNSKTEEKSDIENDSALNDVIVGEDSSLETPENDDVNKNGNPNDEIAMEEGLIEASQAEEKNTIEALEVVDFENNNGWYAIDTKEDLLKLAEKCNADATANSYNKEKYILTSDIDMSGVDWTPINKFYGLINGDGHTIKNLNILIDEDNYTNNEGYGFINSLYCYYFGCGLQNIKFDGITVKITRSDNSSLNSVGGVVGVVGGYSDQVHFENVEVKNVDISILNNPSSTDSIVHMGGICGTNIDTGSGYFKDCTASGTIKFDVANCYRVVAGGLAGEGTQMENCKNDAEIIMVNSNGYNTSFADLSGIIGSCYGKLNECNNNGKITNYYKSYGSSAVGICHDFHGFNDGSALKCNNFGEINGFYAVGCFGDVYSGSVNDCHNYGKVTGSHAAAGLFERITNAEVMDCNNIGDISGDYVSGIVDHIEHSSYYDNSTSLKNCINKGTITGSEGYSNASGIVHFADGPVIIENCGNEGSVIGEDASGIVSSSDIIEDKEPHFIGCYNTGMISGDVAGGISGTQAGDITVDRCYNTGMISGGHTAGGLFGQAKCNSVGNNKKNKITVKNCYNSGTVVASEFFSGGLIGTVYSFDSYALDLLVENCYSIGENKSTTSKDYKGALIGRTDIYNNGSSCNLKNLVCVDDGSNILNIWGNGNLPIDTSSCYAKSLSQMKSKSTFTDLGWDFAEEGIWEMGKRSYPYPILRLAKSPTSGSGGGSSSVESTSPEAIKNIVDGTTYSFRFFDKDSNMPIKDLKVRLEHTFELSNPHYYVTDSNGIVKITVPKGTTQIFGSLPQTGDANKRYNTVGVGGWYKIDTWFDETNICSIKLKKNVPKPKIPSVNAKVDTGGTKMGQVKAKKNTYDVFDLTQEYKLSWGSIEASAEYDAVSRTTKVTISNGLVEVDFKKAKSKFKSCKPEKGVVNDYIDKFDEIKVKPNGEFSGINVKTSVLGYMEFTEDNKLHEGGILISIEGKGSSEYRPACTAGLAYAKFTLGVKAEGGIVITDIETNLSVEGTIKVEPMAQIAIGLGCSVAHVEVGVEGKFPVAELSIPWKNAKESLKITTSVSVYGEAVAFLWSNKKSMGVTGQLWPLEDKTEFTSYAEEDSSENELTFMSRDYRNSINSNEMITDGFSAMEDTDISGTSVLPSEIKWTNVKEQFSYHDIVGDYVFDENNVQYVQLANGTQILSWIQDDNAKDSYNRTSLVYSVNKFDGNGWSVPKRVGGQIERGDFYPQMVSDGNKAYLVWNRAAEKFDSEMEAKGGIDYALKHMDVCFSVYDAEQDSSFSEPLIVSSQNDFTEFTPKVTAENGKVAVSWFINSENDIEYYDGTNSIYVTEYEDESFSESKCYAKAPDGYGLKDYDLKIVNGKPVIAYISDGDGNQMTNDSVVHYVSNGNDKIITGSEYDATTVELADNNIYFASDNQIRRISYDSLSDIYDTGINATNVIATKNSKGMEALTFLDSDEDGARSVYVSYLRNGQYSNPVPIIAEGSRIKNYSVIYNADGTIGIAYNADGVDKVDISDTTEGSNGIVNGIYGHTDMFVKESKKSDIFYISNVLEYDKYMAGTKEEIVLSSLAYNGTSSDISSVHAVLTDSASNTIFDKNLAVDIPVGGSGYIEVPYQVSNNKEVTLTVTPIGVEDNDQSDNVATAKLGFSDLKIDVETDPNNANKVKINVVNNGQIEAKGVDIRIYEYSESLNEKHVEEVSSGIGPSGEFSFDYTVDSLQYDNPTDAIYYYFEAKTTSDESNYENNSATLVFTPKRCESMQLNSDSLSLKAFGEAGKLATSISPEGAVTDVSFVSSDNSVCVVDAEGNVFGMNPGTATITATCDGINGTLTDSCTVTVTKESDDPAQYVMGYRALELIVGDESDIYVADMNNEGKDVLQNIEWTIDNNSIAEILNPNDESECYKVKAKEAGTAVAVAVITNPDTQEKTYTGACIIKVSNKNIEDIYTSESEIELQIGSTYSINARPVPEDTIDSKKFTYKSGSEEVATVDENGLITAVGEGNTQISITAVNGVNTVIDVSVTSPVTHTVSFDSNGGTGVKDHIIPTRKRIKKYKVKYDENGEVVEKHLIEDSYEEQFASQSAEEFSEFPSEEELIGEIGALATNDEEPEGATVVETIYEGNITEIPSTKKDGYQLMGWFSEPDGAGTQLSSDTVFTDDAVYYAYWVSKTEYKVSIDKDEVILSADPQAPNNKYQIKANVMPVDGTIAEFISSNSDIAAVNDDGTIVGISEGTVIITAKAGKGYANCMVTVTDNKEPETESESEIVDNFISVKFMDGKNTLDNKVMKVTGTDEETMLALLPLLKLTKESGDTVNASDYLSKGGKITITSSNVGAAKIDDKQQITLEGTVSDNSIGVIKACGIGNTVVTVTTAEGMTAKLNVSIVKANEETPDFSFVDDRASADSETTPEIVLYVNGSGDYSDTANLVPNTWDAKVNSTDNTKTKANLPLNFMSSDESVATVDENGVITAVGITDKKNKYNKVTITAVDKNGTGKYALCNVIVRKGAESIETTVKTVNSVSGTVNDGFSVNVIKGKTVDLKPVVLPADVTDNRLAYSYNSDSDKAKISISGSRITAKGAIGDSATVLITNHASSIDKNIRIPVTVNIVDNTTEKIVINMTGEGYNTAINPDPVSIDTSAGKVIATLKKYTDKDTIVKLSADILDKDGSKLNDHSVAFTSSNSKVATILHKNDGWYAYANGKGTATITAAALDGSGKKATATITVVKPVESIILNTQKLFMKGGSSERLKVQFTPTDADNRAVTWKTVDESGADKNYDWLSVTKDGRVSIAKTVTEGMTGIVRVQSNECPSVYAICEISVVNTNVSSLKLNATTLDFALNPVTDPLTGQSMFTYGTKELQATIAPLSVAATSEVNNKLTWMTSDPDVFKVDDDQLAIKSVDKQTGKATAEIKPVNPGTAKLWVKTQDGKKSVECKVNVYPIDKRYKLSTVNGTVNIESFKNNTGSEIQLEIKDQYGAVYNPDLFEYKSSDTAIVKVDELGKVTSVPGYDKDATVTVTATLKNDPSKRNVKFKVKVVTKTQIGNIELNKARYDADTKSYIKEMATDEFRLYSANEKLYFSATTIDSKGREETVENTKLKWYVSDTSIASVSADKTTRNVIVTVKKPGTFRVYCEALDTLKNRQSFKIRTATGIPELSAKNVSLNTAKLLRDGTEYYYDSTEFMIHEADGAAVNLVKSQISSILQGRNEIKNIDFSLVNVSGEKYVIRAKASKDVLKSIAKSKPVYTVKMNVATEAIPGLDDENNIGNVTPLALSMKVEVVRKYGAKAAPKIKLSENPVIDLNTGDTCSIYLVDSATGAKLKGTDYEIFENFGNLDVIGPSADGKLKIKAMNPEGLKNGSSQKATLLVGNEQWKEYRTVTITAKYYTTAPKIKLSKSKFNLNTSAVNVPDIADISADRSNVAVFKTDLWTIKAYNSKTKKYDLEPTAINFTTVNGRLAVKLLDNNNDGQADLNTGSYKYRLYDVLDGYTRFNNYSGKVVYTDITVNVKNTSYDAAVSSSGKIDVLDRINTKSTVKLSLKNITGSIASVKLENADNVGACDFYASITGDNAFDIKLKSQATSKVGKTMLKATITMDGGVTLPAKSIAVQTVQSVPKVNVPSIDSFRKSSKSRTVAVNMQTCIGGGIRISKLTSLSVPSGMSVTSKGGTMYVHLNDDGIKAGTYKIKVNCYFKGAVSDFGYPDGKPVTVTIPVKIMN